MLFPHCAEMHLSLFISGVHVNHIRDSYEKKNQDRTDDHMKQPVSEKQKPEESHQDGHDSDAVEFLKGGGSFHASIEDVEGKHTSA